MDLEKVIADYTMHGVYIDNIVVAAQPDALSPGVWGEVRRVCETLSIGHEILPERLMSREVPGSGAPAREPGSAGAPLAPLNDLRLNRPYWALKSGIDFAVALAAIILLLPVIVAVSALVLVDIGIPIVFWQQRVGRNGAPLHLYKFRTLQTLFDRATKERREAQEPSAIGRFLRRTRLDELPQLWNVLSGDMSLIGPRPLLPIDQPDDLTISGGCARNQSRNFRGRVMSLVSSKRWRHHISYLTFRPLRSAVPPRLIAVRAERL